MRVEATLSFIRSAKSIAKKYRSFNDDYQTLVKELSANPDAGVDLGEGVRKVRMSIASKGKGKSGGCRVITFHTLKKEGVLFLIYAYDKSQYDNIILSEIRKIIKDLRL